MASLLQSNISYYDSITKYNLCPRCALIFLYQPSDLPVGLICYEEVHRTVNARLAAYFYRSSSYSGSCTCCCGGLLRGTIEHLLMEIDKVLTTNTVNSNSYNELFMNSLSDNSTSFLKGKVPKRKLFVFIETSGILDVIRLVVRRSISKTTERLFPFPNLAQVLILIVTNYLKESYEIVEESSAELKLIVFGKLKNQKELSLLVEPDFVLHKVKAGKRKFLENGNIVGELDDVTQYNADRLLKIVRSSTTDELDILGEKLIGFVANSSKGENSLESCSLQWSMRCELQPIYLLGRYRKFARDVPQSPWTISVTSAAPIDSESNDKEGNSGADKVINLDFLKSSQRKGRLSVEELVCEIVLAKLGDSCTCKMHPCGREDINVRCLGNGRPFVMEISNAVGVPSPTLLRLIENEINNNTSGNNDGDVKISHLSLADRSVWDVMQTKAEEKQKGYCCVVWSSKPVSAFQLQELEQLSISGDAGYDAENVPCIKISQKTPIRVMHRRSLLTRTRYVYRIETVKLNDHYFLMKLITSAGAYVKEFVHGDMGRTIPSVSAILGCEADILQLDVIQLYDDFPGGNSGSTNNDNSSIEENVLAKVNGDEGSEQIPIDKNITWAQLKSLPLVKFR